MPMLLPLKIVTDSQITYSPFQTVYTLLFPALYVIHIGSHLWFIQRGVGQVEKSDISVRVFIPAKQQPYKLTL